MSRAAVRWPAVTLDAAQLADLGLLLVGAFAPLTGYLAATDARRVWERLRLPDGTFFPAPICLEVDRGLPAGWPPAPVMIALRDPEGGVLAALEVSEIAPSSTDPDRRVCLAGRLEGVRLPALLPGQSTWRPAGEGLGSAGHLALVTRAPLHHRELAGLRELLAGRAADPGSPHPPELVVHPLVGPGGPGVVDPVTLVRCVRAACAGLGGEQVRVHPIPLAQHGDLQRDALLAAVVARAYGAAEVALCGPGAAAAGAAAAGSGLPVLALPGVHEAASAATGDDPDCSPAQLLARRVRLPSSVTPIEVAIELARSYPPRPEQGFVVFLTGLSGAGKSTIARALAAHLELEAGRRVTLLDGDLVRTELTSELGFSRAHRDLNVRRIGFVAAEIARHGGVAVCSAIAPYAAARAEVRERVQRVGGFLLVHVATPLAVCEARDHKGLYARARAGTLTGFTGVDDPYEAPADAELHLDASAGVPAAAVSVILDWLVAEGYLCSPLSAAAKG